MFPYPPSNAFLLCYLLCCPTYWGVAQASYLGIPLGSPSLIFSCLCWCSLLSSIASFTSRSRRWNAERTNQEMIYMSPLMIVVFSLFSPAVLLFTGLSDGFMMILQQFIVNYIVRPKTSQKSPWRTSQEPTKSKCFLYTKWTKRRYPWTNQLLSQARKNPKIATLETTFEIKLRRLALCQL